MSFVRNGRYLFLLELKVLKVQTKVELVQHENSDLSKLSKVIKFKKRRRKHKHPLKDYVFGRGQNVSKLRNVLIYYYVLLHNITVVFIN
jgi:hypothetical protein